MNAVTNEWIKAAEDDLAAIKAMLSDNQLTNVIAFHAQQAVEKAFKGLRELEALPIPRKHDLLLLYNGLSSFITVRYERKDRELTEEIGQARRKICMLPLKLGL